MINSNPELANLFPDSFVYAEELGKWIPEGWEAGVLGDRYIVKGGYAYKSKDFVENNGVPVIKIKSINSDHTIENTNLSFVKEDVAVAKKAFWLNDGDILMAMTGATVGKFGVLVKKKEELVVLNQRVAKFYSREPSLKSLWYVYSFFNDQQNENYIVNSAEGSAQPNISSNQIMSTPMVLAHDKCFVEFEKKVKPLFEKIISNRKKADTLTQVRDTLLPQLISGKVRVPEALLEVINY